MTENYHTHTTRCRHATGTDEEYVLQAIDGGLQVLGFSDHAPFLFPDGYYTHMRMYPDELENYVSSVLTLKEKYAGQIDIRLGLEVEYYPARMDGLLQLIAPFDIEYFILGQHWCGNEQGEPYNGAPTDDNALLQRYCTQVIEGMKTGIFTYLAHPDLLYFVGDADFYRQQAARLCQGAKQYDVPLEINLLGFRSQRHYPREDFWKIAGEIGCKVVFGSDAHMPMDVTDPASEARALEFVEKYQLQLLEHIPLRRCK